MEARTFGDASSCTQPKPHPVLVVSTDLVCKDPKGEYVSVLPISTSSKWTTSFCVETHIPTYKKAYRKQLGAELPPRSLLNWPLTEKSWIRTSHIQPMEKSVLADSGHKGELPPLLMDEVDAALYDFLGFPTI